MFCVLGLPWQAVTKACRLNKTNVIRNSKFVIRCNDSTVLDLQLIQRTPIQFSLCILLDGLLLFRLANTIAICVATWMRWQIEQKILAKKRREVDRLGATQLSMYGECGHLNVVHKILQARYATQLRWL